MQTRTITGLAIEHVKILKQIIIVSENEDNLGSILYTRSFAENYNMTKQTEDDKKADSQIDKFLEGYPQQKNYPVDEIDLAILNSIKKTFTNSTVRCDLIMFNVDLEKLELLKNRITIKSSIYFAPVSPNYDDIYTYVGRTFDVPELSMHIYANRKSELLEGRSFRAEYYATKPVILDKLKTLHFE